MITSPYHSEPVYSNLSPHNIQIIFFFPRAIYYSFTLSSTEFNSFRMAFTPGDSKKRS